MNIGREDAIQDILASLQKQRNDFLDDTRGCSFECNSIMFGALTKQMRLSALLSPEPAAPFIGLRYQELVRKIRSFKTPYWSNSGSYGRHYCRASGAFLPEAIKDNVTGLNLERYSRVRYLHLPTFFTNKSIYEVY